MSGLAELAGALGPVRAAMLLLAAALAAGLGVAALADRRRARRRVSPRQAGTPGPGARPLVIRCAGPGVTPGPGCAEVLALFGNLQPGDVLARWTLDWIGRTAFGTVRVGMRDAAGEPFELELCRLDPAVAPPPATAGELGLYLVAPVGNQVTPEEQGLGAMTLASYLEGLALPAPAWLRPLGAGKAAAGTAAAQ